MTNNNKIFVAVMWLILIGSTNLLGQKSNIRVDLDSIAKSIKFLKTQLKIDSSLDIVSINATFKNLEQNLKNHTNNLGKRFVRKIRIIELFQIREALNTINGSLTSMNLLSDSCQFQEKLPTLTLTPFEYPNDTISIDIGKGKIGPSWERTKLTLQLQKLIYKKELKRDKLKWSELLIILDSINEIIKYQGTISKKQIDIECYEMIRSMKSRIINQCDDLLDLIVFHRFFRKNEILELMKNP